MTELVKLITPPGKNIPKRIQLFLQKDSEQKHQELLSNSRNKAINDLLAETLGKEKIAQMELEQKKRIAGFSDSKRGKN